MNQRKARPPSGFARGAGELGGTAAVVDESYGEGRVVLFASDPNFRGFTSGTQTRCGTRCSEPRRRRTARSRARPGSGSGPHSPVRGLAALGGRVVVTVRAGAATAAASVVEVSGVAPERVRREPSAGTVRFVLAVPPARDRVVSRLVDELAALGDDVLAVYAPR